jgi:hypothetical protein
MVIAMKNVGMFCLLLVFLGFGSCKKNQNQQSVEETLEQSENLTSEKCYKALYEKDTLDLKITTFQDGKVTGSLEMNVFNEPKRLGEIAGEFRGDTLFCAYTFILSPNKAITYKNPMAFLRKENGYILGNGKIENNLGVSYFVKGEPIDFDRVKYKFVTVDCSDNN